jgi:predicted nucleotidyltransferase
METLVRIKEVDHSVIEEIVNRVLQSVQPEKIILFGSHAYGQPHEGSDLDILVIVKSDLPPAVPQAFITTVMKKGKVIYEKK